MSISDDERFEQYLKQFRPIDPEPLQPWERRGARRRFRLAAWTAVAAVLLAMIVSTNRARFKPGRISTHAGASSGTEWLTSQRPLTFDSERTLLAQPSSIDEVVERLIVQAQPVPAPKGKHSALAVLSKEDPRL